MNGGRVVTDRDLYDRLDDQAVHNPEEFTGLDLTQHRLSLGDSEYNRLTKLQKALAEGKPDPAFERHRLGRLFLGEGLRAADVDPNGEEGRTARQRLDRLSGAFESVEGRPPAMADIRSLVGDVLPRVNGDPNIVRASGDEPVDSGGDRRRGVQAYPIYRSFQEIPIDDLVQQYGRLFGYSWENSAVISVADPRPGYGGGRFSTEDIILPNGNPKEGEEPDFVGHTKYSRDNMERGLTSEEFGRVLRDLLVGAKEIPGNLRYGGPGARTFERFDGYTFGIRESRAYGMTIEILKNATKPHLEKDNLKIHGPRIEYLSR